MIPFLVLGMDAKEILKQVRLNLPQQKVELVGSIKLKSPKGYNKSMLPLKTQLNLEENKAHYAVEEMKLNIEWINDKSIFQFSKTNVKPTDEIFKTGITWNDLSLQFLWWPNARIIDSVKKINRDAWLIEISNSSHDEKFHVWIEKEMFMLLGAEKKTLHDKRIQTLSVKKIQEVDGYWYAKQIDIFHHSNKDRTVITIDQAVVL